MDTYIFIVSLLLTLFITTDVTASALLLSKAIKSRFIYVALNERASVALIQAISGSLLGILGANRIFEWNFSNEFALMILSTAVLVQALPSIIWLYLYFRRKFDSSQAD